MSRNHRLGLLAVLGLVAAPLPGQNGSRRIDDIVRELDPYVARAVKDWNLPGLAIGVVHRGRLVFARGYGLREVGKPEPVDTQTIFAIASTTKAITAAALGMLVDEGKLRWDDPVVKHLPGFQLSDPHLTRHITLRDLLCHRTGLQRGDLLGDHFGPAEVLRRLKHLPFAAELRTRLTYSNPMYTVLAEVVARVSRQPWEQFVSERVFQPLRMESTTTAATNHSVTQSD